MSKELALVTTDDLSLVGDNVLNEKQLNLILHKTPKIYVKKRPAKGGGEWEYVTGGYVRKCLNLMFGWDWDFEILTEIIQYGEVVVKGRLTCRAGDKTIVKTQYGNKDIVFKKGTTDPLSIGNDLKAAATDCLKKCAAEIGIAADIYNKEDFNAVNVVEVDLSALTDLFNEVSEKLSPEDYAAIQRIITTQSEGDYARAFKTMQTVKNKAQ